MYKLAPECWIPSQEHSICVGSFHPARLGLSSGVLNLQDDDEGEDKDVFPAACHHMMGYDDISHQTDDARWFTLEPPVHSGLSETRPDPGLSGSDPLSPYQITGADQMEMLQGCVGCCCAEGEVIETTPCVGVYAQREQEAFNPCCSGFPSNYYVVRRNTVVEVEVVEEVAVENTVELMPEDLCAEDFLDDEIMQTEQLYPP